MADFTGWRGLVSAGQAGRGETHAMKSIVSKAFGSLVLIALLISSNGCIITSAVHHAVTLPVKAAEAPL